MSVPLADRVSIRSRVAVIQASTGSVDPREIAEKLLAELDDSELRLVLAEVLPEFVRYAVTNTRRHAVGAPPRSSKVDAVRGWYERLLAQPVDVSGGKGTWKALRDCTRDELLSVAQFRRETAARNVATAEKYEALAKVLVAGKTVASLPQDTVASVFGRAAA